MEEERDKMRTEINGRRLVKNASKRRKKMIAFGWYGGKFSHLDFILPNLPDDAEHFCDVFGGSAAVLINQKPAPVETYNDIDSELVNFFETIRNQGAKLIKAISLTPFSREELIKACRPEPNLSKLERARRFYVRARQTRTGLAQTSSEGRWAHCILTSRAGMAGCGSSEAGGKASSPGFSAALTSDSVKNTVSMTETIMVIKRFLLFIIFSFSNLF